MTIFDISISKYGTVEAVPEILLANASLFTNGIAMDISIDKIVNLPDIKYVSNAVKNTNRTTSINIFKSKINQSLFDATLVLSGNIEVVIDIVSANKNLFTNGISGELEVSSELRFKQVFNTLAKAFKTEPATGEKINTNNNAAWILAEDGSPLLAEDGTKLMFE